MHMMQLLGDLYLDISSYGGRRVTYLYWSCIYFKIMQEHITPVIELGFASCNNCNNLHSAASRVIDSVIALLYALRLTYKMLLIQSQKKISYRDWQRSSFTHFYQKIGA